MDVMKEFQIRAKDGSKSTDETFSAMSKSTFDLWESFNRGETSVAEVASAVTKELQGMDDQVTANQLAVALFGTKWEDLEADAMYAMLGTNDAMKDFEGTMDAASSKIEGSFKNRLVGAWRQLQVGIADTATSSGGKEFLDTLATKAEELVPKVIGIVESAFELGNTIRTHWAPIRETVIGITIAVAALKAGMTAMSIVKTITGFMAAYRAATATGTAAQWALNVAMSANPIGIVITAIAGLVAAGVLLYRNSEKVRQGWDTAWNGIKNATASSVNFVISKINDLIVLLNKIPGVNIPIIPKVQWGNVQAGVDQINKKSAGGRVPQYAVGSDRITHDQFAQIHKDEMIIPARQAQRVRAAGGNIDNIDQLVSQQKQVVTVSSSSGQVGNNSSGITVIIENIQAAGVTVAELAAELVTELKLTLANI